MIYLMGRFVAGGIGVAMKKKKKGCDVLIKGNVE